jgi:CheY-like chemotaxis protein/phosphoribosyl 1,2-cyclic phosphodiesterase
MGKPLSFLVVDDDETVAMMLAKLLERAGARATYITASETALAEILARRPDGVILDIMMPRLDGLELCRRLRLEPELQEMKIVVVSGKPFEFDRRRAVEFGADAYLVKPVDPRTFAAQIQRVIDDRMELRFWGVHGTVPVPGAKTVRYGGNTPCVSLELPRGHFFVFDAGTGIRALSDHLMKAKTPPFQARIFISHPHWDHINAMPFFAPLWIRGNEFEICGPSHGDVGMRELISAQMDGVYFPIRMKEFAATVTFRDLGEGSVRLGAITVKTMLLNHPGNCLGYRTEYRNRAVCYVTDNELCLPGSRFYNEAYVRKLVEFCHGATALITDCCYTDAEYPSKVSWGHSCVSQVVDLACQANVGYLFLFHHDPAHTDDDIDAKLQAARTLLSERGAATTCEAPAEGQVVLV